MPAKIQVFVAIDGDFIVVSGQPPFVEVFGSIDPEGQIFATGQGTVAGFEDILVDFQGKLTPGGLNGEYAMGILGNLPPGDGQGDPIVYLFKKQTGAPTPTITTTPIPTTTPTKQPDPFDTDRDGCSDQRENGPDANLGGQRDFLYFWDFYDVWTHPASEPTLWVRDRTINVFDILGVGARFGPGLLPPAKDQALLDALTAPVTTSGYHIAYDRGSVIGANNWDRAPADGTINIVDDILGTAFQFGHSCA